MAALEERPPSIAMARRYRVFILRDFLLKTYGVEYLKEGPILDVAGGKGDNSWVLANVDGIDSVVADPRVMDATKWVKAANWLCDNPEVAAERASPQSVNYEPLAALRIQPPWVTPRHLKVFVDDLMVSAIKDGPAGTWERYFDATTARAEESEGKVGHHQPKGVAPCDGETNRVKSALEAREVIVSAKLVLGFHPDEATEAAIDLALLLQVPFAVVPCCVFPKYFPFRRLSSGRSVSSFPDFIRYLLEKHPKIRVGKLPFHSKHQATHEGGFVRSTVLYLLPEDYS